MYNDQFSVLIWRLMLDRHTITKPYMKVIFLTLFGLLIMNILSNYYQTFQRATRGKVNIALNNSLLISREVLQTVA